MKKAVYFWILTCAVLLLFFVAIISAFFIRQHSQIITDNSYRANNLQSNESNSNHSAKIKNGKLNINLASVEELQMLPGIGETLARRIVAYRIDNGNFTKIEDLQNVKGIGTATLDAIKNYITIG